MPRTSIAENDTFLCPCWLFSEDGSEPMTTTNQNFALIIPTLNAEGHFRGLLPQIAAQTIRPARFIVLDSESQDRTAAMAEDAGATVVRVPRSEFNHGGTRTIGLRKAADQEVALFMTQDAIPTDERAFERLLSAFDNRETIIAYGRQAPRAQAGPIESFARQFNYPGAPQLRSAADIQTIGFKTCFCSNSFAAYRTRWLLETGGFRGDVIFGEDTIAVAELILRGATIGYIPDAIVEHSHGYTIAEEFRRYFDIGVLHSRESELLRKFGSVGGAGRAYVAEELRYLMKVAP